jgi:hypothetical protein
MRRQELALKRDELELRSGEQKKSGWFSPLVLGVLAAVLGLFGNALIAVLNGWSQRDLAKLQAEAERILDVVKTGNPDTAAVNLKFLLDAHLIRDEGGEIGVYLANRDAGKGIALPTPFVGSVTGSDSARPVTPEDSFFFFEISKAVGSLRSGSSVCTAFLVGPDLVLTAGHCAKEMRGAADFSDLIFEISAEDGIQQEHFTVSQSSIEQRSLTHSDPGDGASYALLRVDGEPGTPRGWLTLSEVGPSIGERLAIVLLRAGQRTILLSSDEDCVVRGISAAEVEHRCDTGGGSSGSPVISSTGSVVGIHYKTGAAIRADAVLAASATLRDQEPASPATPLQSSR